VCVSILRLSAEEVLKAGFIPKTLGFVAILEAH
jgi:hypothetical protein